MHAAQDAEHLFVDGPYRVEAHSLAGDCAPSSRRLGWIVENVVRLSGRGPSLAVGPNPRGAAIVVAVLGHRDDVRCSVTVQVAAAVVVRTAVRGETEAALAPLPPLPLHGSADSVRSRVAEVVRERVAQIAGDVRAIRGRYRTNRRSRP